MLFIPKGAVKIIQKRLKFPKIFAERILGQSGWGTNPYMYVYLPREHVRSEAASAAAMHGRNS